MRKIILILLCFISVQTLAQKEGDGKTEWSNWFGIDCFKGLQFSLKCTGYSVSTKSYWYNIQARNNYNSIVHFNVDYYINGEKITVGLWSINPGDSRTHTSLPAKTYWKNGRGTVSVDRVCFKNDNSWGSCSDGCYAQCDTRAGVPNQPNCNGNSNTSFNNTQSNSNQSNGSNGNSLDKTNDEINRLNVYLNKIPSNDAVSIQIMREGELIKSNANLSDTQMAARFKTLTDRAKKRAEELGAEENKAAQEATRKAKEESDNLDRFKNLNQKGIDAHTAGNFDQAIGYYNQALSVPGLSDQHRAATNNLISQAQQAKIEKQKAEARAKRIDETRKQEAATNAAGTAALAGVATLMTLMQDSYTEKPFSARYYIGFGLEKFIMNVNDNANSQSTIESALPTIYNAGLHFTVFNNKNVNWVINPHFQYNLIVGSTGESGSGYGGGINTHLSFGFSKESPFRLFGEFQYRYNSLTDFSHDNDVASGGTTATDAVYKGNYRMFSQRMGGGIVLRFISINDQETIIRPGYYIEDIKDVGIKRNFFSIDMYFAGIMGVEFGYSKNYVSLGYVSYPNSSKMTTALKIPIATDYLSLKFYRRGLFGKK